MKIPVIRHLVESHSIYDLRKAEEALMEGQPLLIEVDGNDEGEKLTHILASIWILEQMKQKGQEFKDALREYSQKVRESIS